MDESPTPLDKVRVADRVFKAGARREIGKGLVEQANVELADLFAFVIEHGLDLDWMSRAGGVEPQVARRLAAGDVEDGR